MNHFGSAGRGGLIALVVAAACMTASAPAMALESYTVTIKDHKFDPAKLEVAAGERFQIVVINADPTPEEFESNDFHVEKVVNGNSQIRVFAGPLEPGEYSFFGEFHKDTAQGTLTAK